MSTADGYVLPKPGVPKTLGILNVIFGVLLVLLGTCQLGMLALAPMLFKGVEKFAKEAQAKVEANSQAQIKSYDDRIAAAKSDEEKKAIEGEKTNAIARQPKMAPVDMSIVTDTMEDPTIKTVNLGGTGSGLILHIMLLIAGIGLIRLNSWGRSMSLWWAGFQIVQVIALTYATIAYAMPAQQANMAKVFAKMDADAKAKPGTVNPGQAAQQMTKSISLFTTPAIVAQAMVGMVYPIVLLVMLNMAGARAAVLAKKSEGLEGY